MATKRYTSRVPWQMTPEHSDMLTSILAGMFIGQAVKQLKPGSKIVAVVVEAEGPDEAEPGDKPTKPKESKDA